ncbi:MAG: hypothetical protein M3N25_07120 [Actinomycetota bacterium]|nr:hypothetical protein [Actinomycetota bacterium]
MHADAPTRAPRRRPVPWPRRRERDRPGGRRTPPRRPGVSFQTDDPTGLVAELEASDRFCRDTLIGRLYHPKRVTYREISAHDSLHVSVGQGNQVSAHVDRHSPLATRRCGPLCRYSLLRVAAHNVSGMARDLWRVLRVGPRERSDGRKHVAVDEQALLRVAGDPDAPRRAGNGHPPARTCSPREHETRVRMLRR